MTPALTPLCGKVQILILVFCAGRSRIPGLEIMDVLGEVLTV